MDIDKEDKFLKVFFAALKEGRVYMYGGIIPGSSLVLYGTTTKRLVQFPDGDWGVAQSNGVLPPFEKNPVMLDKDDFSKKMIKVGVPKKIVEEFFDFKPESNEYYA